MSTTTENGKHKNYVIYADATKCKGCRRCELACIASHNDMTIKEAIKVRNELEPRVHVIRTETLKMPVQCRQCEHAPCASVCPTQALQQDESGAVVMRTQYCAGCGLCVMACPYGAVTRSFVRLTEEEKARLDSGEGPRLVAVRCDLCEHWRAKEGKNVSACVEACPAGALRMIPVEEYRAMMKEGAVPHTELVDAFDDKDDGGMI
ncbi:4Fe-4S dicluster domain-containing protein [Desulfovibrio sp. OttesenSCG-928-C14]|nr:4Fe-4S dicluster domain-containing protein [Desulfovibrio sp. OttesenSCG-928-C14]